MGKKLCDTLDEIVWRAHFLCRLPEEKSALSFRVPATRRQWRGYWRKIRKEAVGYWHGGTQRIAERLKISDAEWKRMVRFHQPKPPTCIGDSSHDYGGLIEKAATCSDSPGGGG